jgi:hypothetical protein
MAILFAFHWLRSELRLKGTDKGYKIRPCTPIGQQLKWGPLLTSVTTSFLCYSCGQEVYSPASLHAQICTSYVKMEPKASGLLLILAAAAGRAIDFLAARVVSLHSPPPPIGSRQAIDQGELEDQWEVSSRIAAPRAQLRLPHVGAHWLCWQRLTSPYIQP